MPTLFISYKRGTTAIGPLMERLRAAKYRLWFDRDEIHLGDPNWQERIDRGLERSQGVILGITPAACASEPVRYEVRKARELKLPIFPLVLEHVASIEQALVDIGLPKEQHVELFTDADHWDENCERLLRDLRAQELRVTRHDLRAQRGEQAHTLHQRYLRRLVDQIGRLRLSQINPDQPDGVPLEAVYVDAPTPLSISVEVQDWQIVDWWLSRVGERGGLDRETPAPRIRPADIKYEASALESLIEVVEQRIGEYREDNPDAKPDEILYWRNRWHNGSHGHVFPLAAHDIAAARDRLVVLGAPGIGKSTFVRYLALCLAGAQIDGWTRPATLQALGQWPHGVLTPVYVELRRFVTSEHFPANLNELPTADHLWAYIRTDLLGEDLAAYADDLKQDLEQGHAVLILDGLDEVPYPEGGLARRQEQLRQLALSINDAFANDAFAPSRVIVASRPYAYEGWTLPGFEAVTLVDFEKRQRLELAFRLFRQAGLDDKDARAKAERLDQQLKPIDPELKNRPLFLTLMATVFLKGDEEGLPARKGALYRQSIWLLLDRWAQVKPGAPALTDLLGGATLETLYDRLAALAYDVHCQCGDKPGTPEIDEELLYKHLKPMGRHVAADLIPYLSENAGVLVSPGQDDRHDVFHFAHRSFQEYLAASHVVKTCLETGTFDLVRQLIERQAQTWREPCKLVGDVLTDTDRAGDLWDLLDDLLDDDVPEHVAPDDSPWWPVWLAGQIAIEQELHVRDRLRKGEKAVRENLVEWLVCLVQTGGALFPPERAECGMALGLLGDMRRGVGLQKNGIPDVTWSKAVAPGRFKMGGDPEAYNAWKGAEYKLDYSFWLARYPVTYAQFEVFVDDGYTVDEFWTGAGLKWRGEKRHPEYGWRDPRWHIPNHPVVGVTWYEAYAFTQWLDALRCQGGLDLPPGAPDDWVIRLPTEAEWEKAARYFDGRKFPWGDELDTSRMNSRESGIWRTSAVGIFPDGVGRIEAYDLSGNAWEWCLSKSRSDYHFPDNDPEGAAARVLRGGSWGGYELIARCASFDYWFPYYWNADVGFRVVCSAPIYSGLWTL